ncbi:MAG: STT3 domain-containing protein [Candidatus Woesearchaeota archaeon]
MSSEKKPLDNNDNPLDDNDGNPKNNLDDDLEIDFSGIKKFFNKKDKTQKEVKKTNHQAADEEESDVDFSGISNFFKNEKRNKILLTTLLILIPVILTLFIRIQPQYLPATDAWAENSVDNYYRNMIAQQINAQYPNLPAQQKDQLVADQFEEFKKTNRDQLKAQTDQTSAYFKTGFQYTENDKTYTFIGDLDSYYYLRQAKNLKQTGTVCDEIREGKCIDTYMLEPVNGEIGVTMHPYGIVYLYNVLHFFSPSVNLMQAQFYLPTLLAVIAAIAAFFIGRRLMNDVAGFFAAMFLALSPLFITRTLGSDTDIWNVMFPLIILWIFLEAYESKDIIKKAVLGAIAGLLVGCFSFAWTGWWYIFLFIILAVVLYFVFEIIRNFLKHKNLRKTVTKTFMTDIAVFIIFIIVSGIFVSTFTTFSNFTSSISAPLGIVSTLKIAAHSNLWPNVYTTVAELNEANIPSIIGQLSFGANILFALALLGIVLTMVKKKPDFKEYILIVVSAMIFIYLISSSGMSLDIYTYMIILALPIAAALIMLLREKESTVDIKPAILLTVWFLGMIFASTKGVRFVLLLIPAFSIALAVTIGYLYQYFSRVLSQEFKLGKAWSNTIVIIILCLLLINPIKIGIAAGENFVPSITKGWYDSLIKIRDESKPDAIINSWWDFGHWFKYFADRGVTADGASQNTPQAHWLGLALQTNDEKRSVAVLRMLDCGGNNAFDEIDKKYLDSEISENIVTEIIMLDEDSAKEKLLDYGYSDSEISKILRYTHCSPPENYFITSEDMVGKAGVWAHFGLWDFDRAYIINEVKPKSFIEGTALLKERFNYSDTEASRIYYEVQALQTDREMNDWIAPWPGYAGGTISCGQINNANITKNMTIQCNLNMGLSNNGQTITALDSVILHPDDPSTAQLNIGIYDQSGRKLQEASGSFSEIVVMDNSTKKYKSNNASINLAFLLSINNNGNETAYTALVADPLLIDSTFTKLFFLEGKNMKQFEKFYDTTDITGSRIIVWKVKWK